MLLGFAASLFELGSVDDKPSWIILELCDPWWYTPQHGYDNG